MADDATKPQADPTTPLPPAPANNNVPFKAANENAPTTSFDASSNASNPFAQPPHTRTESTLAPTSEFVRYFLLAYPSRYLFRGLFGVLTGEDKINETGAPSQRFRQKVQNFGKWFGEKVLPRVDRKDRYAVFYNSALGVGSATLTASYSWMVYKDIKSIFSEAVAEEMGKQPKDITYNDIAASDNKIVKATMHNFKSRLFNRLFTDMLFFPAAWLRDTFAGDFMLGVKGVQLLSDTWKRKTTMFEDFVTFINNKINPRNGLGQPITVGEVFDLFQHYTDAFHTDHMFTNVLERGTGEGAVWAKSQPIFQRIAQLMNKTYAYKHESVVDPTTGHAIRLADFALPKFIYMLGHDLIDPYRPERTLALLEVYNARGVAALKQATTMLDAGTPADDVLKNFALTMPTMAQGQQPANENNGVVAKGSTMQLERTDEGVTTQPRNSISALDASLQPANENSLLHARSGMTV
jgi:hypothetical protein